MTSKSKLAGLIGSLLILTIPVMAFPGEFTLTVNNTTNKKVSYFHLEALKTGQMIQEPACKPTTDNCFMPGETTVRFIPNAKGELLRQLRIQPNSTSADLIIETTLGRNFCQLAGFNDVSVCLLPVNAPHFIMQPYVGLNWAPTANAAAKLEIYDQK